MRRLYQFNEFINESLLRPELNLIKMSVTYLFEGERVSGPSGILSIEDPRNRNLKIEDNEGDFYEELGNMCDYLEETFGPPPYKISQFKGKGLIAHMSEMYMDNARTEGSRIYLDIEEIKAQDILDADPTFREEMFALSGFSSPIWITVK